MTTTSPPNRNLGRSGLEISPVCLGGNVFGLTADKAGSFAVLDAYFGRGGNFLDTADTYPRASGGGTSEEIIGEWMTSRRVRDQIVLSTKVGARPGRSSLRRDNVKVAVAECLERLRTDRIDLLYAHVDDEDTPLEETLGAFDDLVSEGRVRHVAASNYRAERLEKALAVSDERRLPRFQALQTHYSLLSRPPFESRLRDVCMRESIACVPYWGLERGFLTGKYRPGGPVIDSPKAAGASAYLNDPRALAILAALDDVARDMAVGVTAVTLAWLGAQPGVACVLVSARNPEQLREIFTALEIELTHEQMELLASAST